MKRVAFWLIVLLFAAAARAGEEAPVTLAQIHHPTLLLKTTTPGAFLRAPSVSTDVSLQIRGIVARATVRQRFENNTGRCVEAVYAFPLAENATVDAMRLKIGERTITGQIRERQEAAQVYEQARREGRQASLLEQHRPNLFTVSVASLPDGATADVEIEYQQIVTWDERFSLRIPLAIGPRYVPAASEAALPAMRFARTSARRNPVAIEIDLDAGIDLGTVLSPTHELETIPVSATRVKLRPRDVQIASDRDFELVWTPRLGAKARTAAFTEVVGGSRYTLLMLFPPDLSARPAAALPRDTTFIIDTSGSMGGPSMEQAKEALLTALRRLRPSDRFNVIEFDDDARKLFDASRPADRAAVEEALRWVGALESDGGTEMLEALRLALAERAPAGVIRQVVFITDGQVGNEEEIFAYIRAHLGETRLFTVGIGHAPNSFFMRNAARAGRGTFTHVGDLARIEETMTAMFRKLESPVLSDVAVQTDAGAEVWPERVPDLYAGEPLVVTMRAPSADPAARGRLTASGWSESFAAAAEESHGGIAKLWARQKIDALRDSVFAGANGDAVRKEIVTLALQHHIVTEHTSLVAVDTTPAGVDPKSCTSELVPVNLPAGWGGIEGALPRTGTPAALLILVGCALLLIARRVAA